MFFVLNYFVWSFIITLAINSDFKIVGFGKLWRTKTNKAFDITEKSGEFKVIDIHKIRLSFMGWSDWQYGLSSIVLHLLTSWFLLPVKIYLLIKQKT